MTSAGSDAWPTVYFSILNWNQKDLTCECLESLAQLDYPNYKDEELAERYGSQGREYVVEKWTWEQAVQRLERHLISVAAGATECLHLRNRDASGDDHRPQLERSDESRVNMLTL